MKNICVFSAAGIMVASWCVAYKMIVNRDKISTYIIDHMNPNTADKLEEKLRSLKSKNM